MLSLVSGKTATLALQRDLELTYLCQCLEDSLFKVDSPRLSPPGLNWHRLYQLVIENKLAGLFYKWRDPLLAFWPEELSERLRLERYNLMLSGDWRQNQARNILESLRE